MVDWTPYVLFLASVAISAFAQRHYIDHLARCGQGVRSDASVAAEIRDRPWRLAAVVTSETLRRLKALSTRQPDRHAERLRRIAILSIALSIACFLWAMTTIV